MSKKLFKNFCRRAGVDDPIGGDQQTHSLDIEKNPKVYLYLLKLSLFGFNGTAIEIEDVPIHVIFSCTMIKIIIIQEKNKC